MSDPPRTRRPRDLRPYLALLAVQLCFGSFPVFGKLALAEVQPLVLAALRAVAGAAALTLLARILDPGGDTFDEKDRRMLIVLSFFGIVANQVLFIFGLSKTTATNATLLTAMTPILTLAVVAVLAGNRPSPRRLLGIPVAFAGLLWLLDVSRLDFGDRTSFGNALILANALSYSIFLVLARGILRRHSAVRVTAAIFRYAALPVVLLALTDLVRFRPAALSARAWTGIAGTVILATVVSYALNAWALARTGAATTAMFIYIQPLVAITLAKFVLRESPSPRTAVAAALIFVGIALATWPARAPAPRRVSD
ncbi:MAG: DMT family transporter [Acidobacteriota bacterium]|nr:DMT family transporter [Acidobacteriota bacterium]